MGVNRAEKTRQYLVEQVQRFRRVEQLRQSRKDFFAAISTFRQSTVSYLRKTAIVSDRDLGQLGHLFEEIDSCKTKGSENEVYWNRVGPAFSRVILSLDELADRMHEVKVPFLVQVRDSLWDLSLLQKITVGVTAALITALIIYLISTVA
jgi:hypothetical protein